MKPPRSVAPPETPLHVLTITPFYPKYGNEGDGCFVAEPLAALAKMGVQSTVFAVQPFYRPLAGKLPSSMRVEWFRYPALPGGPGLANAGLGLFMRLQIAIKKLHAHSPIHLIHAHGALPCGHAARLLSRRMGIPYVVTVHGLDAFSTRQVSGRWGASCERVSKKVYCAAARVLGVSKRVCEEVHRGTEGQSRTSTVYNGVDPILFAPTRDPENPVILTVGNLIPTKGHESILHALSALRAEFPTLLWKIIGEGPEWARIRDLAEQSGVLPNIVFLSRRNRVEVAEAFQRCTVFALPSSYEGLGCVYLEAMASGKVAIGCVGQGIDEVIRHGENGWLVQPGSRDELTDGLRLLLRDASRRAQISIAARQTILQSCTLDCQATQLLTVYQETTT